MNRLLIALPTTLVLLAALPLAAADHFSPHPSLTCIGGYNEQALLNVCYREPEQPQVQSTTLFLGCYYVLGNIPGCQYAQVFVIDGDRGAVFVETSWTCHSGGPCVQQARGLP